MTDWGLLREAIGGELVLAGSPGYESARKPALDRYEVCRPQAIVLACQTSDVVAAIGFARRHGLRTSSRSGGHCFAGRSSMGDIIIDVTPINAVSIVDGVATVGAGARLGDLNAALAIQGRTLPSGSEPSVGIAGITLGGGLGTLGRMHGLTSDHLLSAQVVLADGTVVDCDDIHDSDLFWALRGAGGGQFGVVTSLTFNTVPAQRCTTFCLMWPHVRAAAAIVEAWQDWAPRAPNTLDANLQLRPAAVVLFGAMTGTTSETEALLDDFIAMLGATPYRAFGRPQAAAGHMFSKSEFFRQPLPRKAIAALLDEFFGGTGPARQLNFTPWGGAYNRVPSDATAFAHRAELFMIEHVVTVAPAAPRAKRDEARAWLARSWASVHPWGSGGVYPNFPDPDLETGAEAYHGANYGRLLRVKRLYDPGDWFRFPQSIASQTDSRFVTLATIRYLSPREDKMTGNTDVKQQDAALRVLDRLVGTWQIGGDATGTVTYRWLEGGFFLAQEGELELFGHRNKFTEIIGRERPFGGEPSADIKSRSYTADGDTLDYVYEMEGDTLTIWGGYKGSEARYTGNFSADGNTLTGEWSWPDGGYRTVTKRQPQVR